MKIAVGVSGGVDSAVTALLLKERGYEVVGVTMALGRDGEETSIAEARQVAERIGIEFHIVDLAKEWNTNVLNYIKETYLAGRTPNPCVRCNETVKFNLLPRYAFEKLGCEKFATGHYARLEDGHLFRGKDRGKDQSYFLYRVAKDILERTLFPLGAMCKNEVREKARQFGFVVADKHDSQDFCGGDPMNIVNAADLPGNIVDESGKVLGHHNGFWHYTVGKRKGLGIGGGTPYYVVRLDAARNEVVIGFRDRIDCVQIELRDVVTLAKTAADEELMMKVRSAGEPKGPVVWDGGTHVKCAAPIAGVAPGQSAVFYRGEEVVGGGIIERTEARGA